MEVVNAVVWVGVTALGAKKIVSILTDSKSHKLKHNDVVKKLFHYETC